MDHINSFITEYIVFSLILQGLFGSADLELKQGRELAQVLIMMSPLTSFKLWKVWLDRYLNSIEYFCFLLTDHLYSKYLVLPC